MWMIWMFPMCRFKLVKNMQPSLNESCLWHWKTWPSHNTKIHYGIPPYVKVGINLRFKSLNLKIMFICNK